MTAWIFPSQEQRDRKLALLKCLPCPHCKHTGALNRHGYLKGYDERHFKQKAVRAVRVFCSNRTNNPGCGRTFSVWIAQKIKRLFLDAQTLWNFLEQVATTGNKAQAFRNIQSSMSDSAPYRIWKRFLNAQSFIRTTLTEFCLPNKTIASEHQHAAGATLAHLKAALGQAAGNPIAAFQNATQSFFI